MQKLSNRFKELRAKLGLKQSELAKIMGAGEATIKAIEQERTLSVKPKYALALSEKLKINREWLEHGRGEMFITEHGELLSKIAIIDKALNTDSLTLPYYEDISDTQFYANIIMPIGIINNPSKELVAIKINDDSMKGTIERGNMIFLNMDDTELSSGKIYKIIVNGETLIKRIYKTNGDYLLKSDNPLYPERILSANEFDVLGRVVATMSISLL